MNEKQFENFIQCILDKEFVEERKQSFYLEAFEGCLVALVNLPCLTDEDAKRKTTIVITRAYVGGLITAQETQRLMAFRDEVLRKYRKGLNV